MRFYLRILPLRDITRRIYFIALMVFFCTLELMIAYCGTHSDFPDRITLYFVVPMLAFLFHRFGLSKKNVVIALICISLLSCILVTHGALIYGNGLGFTLENLLFLQNEGAFKELFLISSEYILTGLLLIFAVTAGVTGVAVLLLLVLRPILRREIPMRVANILIVLSFLLSVYTLAPLKDGLKLIRSIYTELQIWNLDPDIYKKAGIKIYPGDYQDVKAVPGRNLVLIILESTERTYLDQKLFPGLLPNLSAFAEKAQDFRNISMAHNAQVTHSALYSIMTGAYMTGSHFLRKGHEMYNPNIGCRLSSFPKVLNRAGYQQFFLVGCSGNFAGLENVVKEEKFDVAWFGRNRSMAADKWNFAVRDSKVYEQAWRFFQKAAAAKRPFNITLLTIDAHGADGFYDPSEPAAPLPPSPQSHLYNAMYASDAALGKFLKKIAEHPAAQETCIVIVSDHLAHHFTRSVPILEKNPDRRMLFLIFNSVKNKFRPNIKGKTFDVGPTILAALGVKHDYKFPLGENLYGKPCAERLNSDDNQTRLLSAYVHLKSRYPAQLPCDLQLQSAPYPMLRIGKFILPLRHKGIIDFPSEGVFLYLPIPANRKLWSESWRFCSSNHTFELATRVYTEYIFVTANTAETAKKYHLPEGKGKVLGVCLNGKKLVKYASPGTLPEIRAEEISSMLKR